MVSTGARNVGAVLAAAGSGSRFGDNEAGRPKQVFELMGRPVYLWSLEALCQHPEVKTIVVVTRQDLTDKIRRDAEAVSSGKTVLVIPGGATRQESVFKGLSKLAGREDRPDIAIVHDAARPFLSRTIIDSVIEGIADHGACTTAIKVTDTVKKVVADVVTETLDRDSLVLVQTPQGAKFDMLYEAHKSARAKNLDMTDDGAVLEAAGHKVYVVEGARQNLKLTRPEDLDICESIARAILKHAR